MSVVRCTSNKVAKMVAAILLVILLSGLVWSIWSLIPAPTLTVDMLDNIVLVDADGNRQWMVTGNGTHLSHIARKIDSYAHKDYTNGRYFVMTNGQMIRMHVKYDDSVVLSFISGSMAMSVPYTVAQPHWWYGHH
jgi:hypothetical protein